jgi:hypothetical protein
MSFDPDERRLYPEQRIPERKVPLPSERARRRRLFIPAIPLDLFDRACVLPRKSLAIFLLLWRKSKMERSDTVVLTTAGLAAHGITRREKATALRHLERAGLVTVRRRRRNNPEVTVVQPPEPP